ncbi:MAG: hypothetical protein AVDCRST_MAG38-99, partial [uncultured Solirubrobacteraceae bacterium]
DSPRASPSADSPAPGDRGAPDRDHHRGLPGHRGRRPSSGRRGITLSRAQGSASGLQRQPDRRGRGTGATGRRDRPVPGVTLCLHGPRRPPWPYGHRRGARGADRRRAVPRGGGRERAEAAQWPRLPHGGRCAVAPEGAGLTRISRAL